MSSSSWLGAIFTHSSSSEGGADGTADDPTILSRDMQFIYEDPFKILGVDDQSKPWEIRDAFRQLCINMNPDFVSVRGPKNLKFKHALLAYRLAIKDLPHNAQLVLTKLEEKKGGLTLAEPSDIIPTLRPLKTNECKAHSSTRACKSLFIDHKGTEVVMEKLGVTYTYFILQVTYMLRTTICRHKYQDFHEFHARLKEEWDYLPELPDTGLLFSFGLGDLTELSTSLARYLLICFRNLAARGFYSSRLMEFLGVDVGRYHWEEEARMIKCMDTTASITGGHWQIIPEEWLNRWRKFIQSKEARRYLPPGKLDNRVFYDEAGVLKKDLKLVKDYRVVNYNVWRYWQLVYSAGPSICRKDRDIYSDPGIGTMQAVILIQNTLRRALARARYFQKKLQAFSKTLGAREALWEVQVHDRQTLALIRMKEARKLRIEKNMIEAIKFTQDTWRRKKGVAATLQQALEKQKHVQEVFRQLSPHEDVAAAMGRKFVVEEAVPIVAIPSTEEYDVTFPIKLNIGLKKHPCTEMTYVWDVQEPTEEEYEAGTAPSRAVIKYSILLVINGHPVSSLTHEEKMLRLKSTPWPLRLKFRRPLTEEDVSPLPSILSIENETLRLHQLKRRLMAGIPAIKHGRQGSPHETIIYLSETHLFWEGRREGGSPKKKNEEGDGKEGEDSSRECEWAVAKNLKAMSLYELKFCLGGKQSPPLRRMSAARVKASRCLTIFAEDKDMVIELKASKITGIDDEQLIDVCNLLIWGFSHIIQESRDSLFYVDAEGNPVRRTKPKTVLKTVG